ncbi:aminoglycoside phosphotransferase family protein [Dactylosporangium vinaceum]|uniref:Aminoglycoside phosphotransferase family protein n=1 Tax=Dactylosporangium vinaceum TaxID=53362 RepID=A0ABV5MJF7_9ACTN|nr:aminoglycoside phosphotransferase family protein [Dactylosporangium vinaceum]UAB93576.1 aminoglycoside phosphotransferase family protein [Dactylosporangium vinaceum]
MDEVLQATPHRTVTRVGDTVRRPVHPWSGEVHALLAYLERVGFPYSPRFLGIDEQGREILTYLDGESGGAGWRHAADEGGLAAMGRLLREYHDAVAGFRPAPDGRIMCHGDFGPWNLVWRAGAPVGILDWDYAVLKPPVHDVAYALEYVAPFRDDEEALRSYHHPAPPDRQRRIGIFARAYGIDPDGLAEQVVLQQECTLDLVRRLAAEGVQPQADWVRDGLEGEMRARIAWSRRYSRRNVAP